jgi:polysaccharide biosynthesis/export protein
MCRPDPADYDWRPMLTHLHTCVLLYALLIAATGPLFAQAPAPADFNLGPGDVLNVSIWKQPGLSLILPVAPDGSINYPLIGQVRVAGLTVKQLEEVLSRRLRDHVRDAQVTVTLSETHSYRIYVVGEVSRPGEFEVKLPITVLQAIAIAGGFTPFASRGKVAVVSRAPGAGRRGFDYDGFVAGKEGAANFVLLPGDTVVVR